MDKPDLFLSSFWATGLLIDLFASALVTLSVLAKRREKQRLPQTYRILVSSWMLSASGIYLLKHADSISPKPGILSSDQMLAVSRCIFLVACGMAVWSFTVCNKESTITLKHQTG